jgi:hypothetical protein
MFRRTVYMLVLYSAVALIGLCSCLIHDHCFNGQGANKYAAASPRGTGGHERRKLGG